MRLLASLAPCAWWVFPCAASLPENSSLSLAAWPFLRRLISYCVRVRGAAGEGCGGEGDG